MNIYYTSANIIKQIGLVFCFFCLSLSAQDEYADSVKLVIKNSKHDTTLCMALNDLGEYFYNQNPDSSLFLWKKSIKICEQHLEKTKDKNTRTWYSILLARAYMDMGFYFQSHSGPDEALNYFKKALSINAGVDEKRGMADCLSSIGQVYAKKGDALQALEYYHKCLKIHEQVNELHGLGFCLGAIGNLYASQNDLESALSYLNRSVKTYEEAKNNKGIAFGLSSIATLYNDNGDPECKDAPDVCSTKSKEKALKGFLKVLSIESGENNSYGIAGACLNIASVYRSRGELENALDYANRGLSLYESLKNKRGIASASNILANIMFDKGNIKVAEDYANKSIKVARELGYPQLLMSVYTVLKKIYVKQNKYKDALEMQELSVKMRDSINNETTRKASIKKQFELEYEQQAAKDSIVNAINAEKQLFRHEQAISKQRLYTLGGVLGFVLMLIVALVSFRAYKTKQKANTIITEQNAKIEMANKDLRRQHVLNQKIFSVISHDFRGPMLSLNLVLDKFKDSANEKLNNYLKDIGASVNNANTVLNNLLNWAKAEIALESFDQSGSLIDEVVEKTEKEFAEKLNEKELKPVWRIPAGAMIKMPQDILQIAIRNLISNAIKFSNRGGKIEIVYDAENTSLMIKDFGVGISPERQAQLFNNQVNSGVGTNKEEGFGIGLYIVSELLYKYGFNINVESKLSEGASFRIMPVK